LPDDFGKHRKIKGKLISYFFLLNYTIKMDKEELVYLNAFNLFEKFGGTRLNAISNFFSSFKSAWFSSTADLKMAGVEESASADFLKNKKLIDPEKEFEKLKKEKIEILTIKDAGYPKILKEISLPPFLLYTKGALFEKEPCIAIVGTRRCSNYGKQIAEELAADLSEAGLTIVSGLARGIDTAAHKTVASRGKRTIAVLGSGINDKNIYPQENLKLAKEIISVGGAIISEFPFGDVGLPYHFPQRNRIISGLSLGTIVVESKMKSGAMITASWAADQGREVFAVPGQINFLTSEGPNYLIKQGAKLVSNANDILEEFNLQTLFKQKKIKITAASPEEEKILKVLENEPLHVDEIIEKTKLSANIVSSTITIMEITGKIKNLGKNIYTTPK